MKLTDPVTKWSFECLADSAGKPLPGGIALKSVTHEGHNFAKDIRVVGIWIETEVVAPSGAVISTAKAAYILDSATFTVSNITTLSPKPMAHPNTGKVIDYLRESDEALQFAEYFKEPGGNYAGYGVTAKFDAPALMTGFPNCIYAGLSVEQIFLFSRYGNSPRHEPSGGLSAARCHPMIRYAFSPNPAYDAKKQYTRVSSIRFDYRLHLFLDRHYDLALNPNFTQIGNQAGLFADSDTTLGTAAVAIGSGIWNILEKNTAATAISRGAFDAVEKPLVLEVTAPGLAKGFSVFQTMAGRSAVNVRCWDNVHWWGARGPGQPLISAPGAFHCAHLHWRWGAAAKASPALASPTFNPDTWPTGMPTNPAITGMWGPLVDPGIWIQSVRIAVTKNESRLNPDSGVGPRALSKPDWKSLFDPSLRATPADISAGEDIVLWYSAEVHAEVTVPSGAPSFQPAGPSTFTSKPGGTVFIHGLFFAHDAEKPGLAVGSTDPAYRPTSEPAIRAAKAWFRSAK